MSGAETSGNSATDRFDDQGASPDSQGELANDGLANDGLGSLAQSARTGHLKSARITMYVIGVLTVGVNLFFALGARPLVDSQFAKEVDQLQRQGMEIDQDKLQELKEQAVTATRIEGFGFAGLGALFFVLGALIYKAPVPCTVLALVLYLAGQAMTGLAAPEMLAKGILIKIIIIVALVKAVQAAIAYRREQAVS